MSTVRSSAIMMIHRYVIVPLVLFSVSAIAPSLLDAQVKVDIKTKWTEKKELTVVKGGVIGALRADASYACVEFGEDYALWLKDVERTKVNSDTIVLTLALELREGSLMDEGDLLSSSRIEVRYSTRTLDSLRALDPDGEAVKRYVEEHALWNRLIGNTVGSFAPFAKPLVGAFATAIAEEINMAPEPEEVYEATLVGMRVLIALDDLVITASKREMAKNESAKKESSAKESPAKETKSSKKNEG